MSSTASMSNAARDMAKDAKDAVKHASKAAEAGGEDVRDDLEAVREDIARLTAQIGELLAAKGNVAWRKAKSGVEGVISDAETKGQEAVHAVREVGDNVIGAVDESIKTRPYTTLALALGLGILFGATWRR